ASSRARGADHRRAARRDDESGRDRRAPLPGSERDAGADGARERAGASSQVGARGPRATSRRLRARRFGAPARRVAYHGAMNQVVDFINVNRDRYVDELKQYLAIPSISALPQHAADTRRA